MSKHATPSEAINVVSSEEGKTERAQSKSVCWIGGLLASVWLALEIHKRPLVSFNKYHGLVVT